jgi:Rieske Fe-S protein
MTGSVDFAVSRRAMLRGAVLALAGGIGGFFIARNSAAAKGGAGLAAANGYAYSPPKNTGSSNGKRLASVNAIPVGGGVVLGNAHVVLTRDSGGALHAFSAICTHQGCTVSSVRDGVISCPCHGSRFNANTGAVVNGPASRPLPPVTVKIVSGVVYAH